MNSFIFVIIMAGLSAVAISSLFPFPTSLVLSIMAGAAWGFYGPR